MPANLRLQPEAGKVILPEHLDHTHRWYVSRNPDDQLRVLREAGQHIGSWTSCVIDQARHPDEAWRRLLGLQHLLRQYPSRLDTVCRIALSRNLTRLADLKHLLASQEDLTLLRTEALSPEFDLGSHPNIRGSHYYAPAKEAVS